MLIHGASLLDARGENSDGWIIAEDDAITGTGIGETWRDHEAAADLDTVVDATRFACRVAAKTCERAGASPPYRREL